MKFGSITEVGYLKVSPCVSLNFSKLTYSSNQSQIILKPQENIRYYITIERQW